MKYNIILIIILFYLVYLLICSLTKKNNKNDNNEKSYYLEEKNKINLEMKDYDYNLETSDNIINSELDNVLNEIVLKAENDINDSNMEDDSIDAVIKNNEVLDVIDIMDNNKIEEEENIDKIVNINNNEVDMEENMMVDMKDDKIADMKEDIIVDMKEVNKESFETDIFLDNIELIDLDSKEDNIKFLNEIEELFEKEKLNNKEEKVKPIIDMSPDKEKVESINMNNNNLDIDINKLRDDNNNIMINGYDNNDNYNYI